MTTWLIQPTSVEISKIDYLIDLLTKGDIPFEIVYPLNGKILTPKKEEFKFKENEKYFVCGSYPLTRYAHAQRPDAVFSIEEYKFEDLMTIFGKENFVNSNAKAIHTNDINWNANEEYFIRPFDDTKSFNGGIYNQNTLKYEGMVIQAELKHIPREYRFFVINNSIVTGSLYKVNGSLEESDIIDPGAVKFAEKMIENFKFPGFVIDIAQVDDSYKIMELNCLNASGFYSINLYKFVLAVEEYYENVENKPHKSLVIKH